MLPSLPLRSGMALIVSFLFIACAPDSPDSGSGDSGTAGSGSASSGQNDPIDAGELERIEDLSESLANDLLDLSVASRRRDIESMSNYFAANVSGSAWPSTREPVEPAEPAMMGDGNSETGVSSRIHQASWRLPAANSRSGEDAVADWDRFLGLFKEIEDVRFKVKKALFDSETGGHARVYAFVIGRNAKDQREWIKVWAEADFTRSGAEDTWRFRNIELESVTSLYSEVDLFSEVAQPAGVALQLPRYGAPGNEGFVWHGAAAIDIDQDGDVDVMATGVHRNYVYLNRGDGTFVESAAELGVAQTSETAVAPLFVDYDNDGDSDLFLSASGNQMLFENRLVPDGNLNFQDVSLSAGVDQPAIGFSATAADVNGDGFPDIYVNSYQRYGVVMPNDWAEADNGTPNLLFLNQGDGTFEEVAADWGLNDSRWSYASEFVDIDGDHDLDVYVANDFGTNGFYRNDGDRFVDIAEEAGVVDPGNGMGVSFGDYDNDGDLDLHVTNMSSTAGNRILGRLYDQTAPTGQTLRKLASGNSVYERMDDGSWKSVTQDLGSFSAGWAWGGGFVDLDNDGWEDVYSPNGFVSGKLMKDT